MKQLNILIANHHLKGLGGSETFTYALAEELIRRGHQVHYFTYIKGEVSEKMETLGAREHLFSSGEKFDLALVSHQTIFRQKIRAKLIVQTCHGLNRPLEQPSLYADRIVAVSERIAERLKAKNYNSTVIPNGINCRRFFSVSPINLTPSSVLSLCRHEEVNKKIAEACRVLGLGFNAIEKEEERIWSIEKKMNQADIVVTLGRGAAEAMACGRNVLVYDHRNGFGEFGEGMITSENMEQLQRHNFSGSFFRRHFETADFVKEFQKYDTTQGRRNHTFIVQHQNIETTVDQYLSLKPLSLAERFQKQKRIFLNYLQNVAYAGKIISYDEVPDYFQVLFYHKKYVVNKDLLNRIASGKQKVFRFSKYEIHRFELLHPLEGKTFVEWLYRLWKR